jgi:hypothetical protein
MLGETYEKMIVAAMLDSAFAARLLADPSQAAIDAGLGALVAESVAGLRADTVGDFAAALHRRLYGAMPARSAPPYSGRGPLRGSDGYAARSRIDTAS